MVHLKNIGLENFRVFKEQQWFDFAPITILTGTNSSGKSAVINALRLLQENYRNIKSPDINKLEEFDFSQLIENDFDSENILERFGNIAQLVNRDSTTDAFSFSFHPPGFYYQPFKSDDVFEIRFTITVQKNQLRNGKLSRVEIYSQKKNSIIFSLFEKTDNGTYWAARIDLDYYYLAFLASAQKSVEVYDGLQRIKKQLKDRTAKVQIDDIQEELDDLNLRYNESYTIDYIKKWILTGHIMNVREVSLKGENFHLFNYDALLKLPETENLQRIVNERYKGDKGLLKLTEEIIKFLSCIEWNDKEQMDQDWKITDMHFLRWKPDNFAKLSPFSIDYIANPHKDKLISTGTNKYKIVSSNQIDEVLDKYYIENEANLKVVDFDAVREFIKCTIHNQNNESYIKANATYNYFYNLFLVGHLTQILAPFQQLNSISFLSAHRTLPKRINSLLEVDNFSKLIKELLLLNSKKFKEVKEFANEWVQKFDIGDSIEIEKDIDTAQFKFYLYLKSGKKTLLADAGFGVLQIMPLILSCMNTDTTYVFELNEDCYNNKIVAIEEPESNLHPSLQSQLADMFVEASNKFNIQFIIETHSEYLIRKLQYLTAKTDSTLKREDTVIYYLYPPDKIPVGEDQVKKININEDGSLTDDFGSGFFDEADKIALELFLLKKIQSN